MAELLKVWCFKGVDEFIFLFCCFANYYGVILVNRFQWWSAILAAQWIFFMSYVNHDFARGLVRSFQGNRGTRKREIHMMLVEVKEADFWQKDEAKFLVLKIIKTCGVDLEVDCNQLWTEVDLNFFLSWILTLDLTLCKKCQEEIRRSSIFIFKDQHKGNDEWIKDFRSGCCGNAIFDSLEVLMWMCNVVFLKREYLLGSVSSKDFGNKGMLWSV